MLEGPSKHKSLRERLFVAGIPSGINPQMVADYFSEFGLYSLGREAGTVNVDRTQPLQPKGHCVLRCFNRPLSELLLRQRYFGFLGRTLAVSLYRTGPQLIVDNKRQNKCRVIFKKVSSKISELDFKAEIESRYGQLLAFFQFKSINPLSQKKTSGRLLPKHFTYSAIFKDQQTANLIIEQREVRLRNGSVVEAHKFQKAEQGKGRRERKHVGLKSLMSRHSAEAQFPKPASKSPGPEKRAATLETINLVSQNTGELLLDHIKPTTRQYFTLNVQGYERDMNTQRSANTRFNLLGTHTGNQIRQSLAHH